MKEIEFYQRAAADAAFRKAKLDDLRYFKNVSAGGIWFCVVLAVAFSLYGGLTEGRWELGGNLLFMALLSSSTWTLCRTRIAALEALDAARA